MGQKLYYTSSLIRHTLKDEKVSLCQLYLVLLSCLFFLKYNIIPCFVCSLAWGCLFGKKIQVLIKFESRGPLPTRDKGVSTRPKQQGRFVRIFGPDQSNLKYDKFMILFFYTDSTHEVKTRHAYGISTPWCYNRLQKLTWGTRNGNSVCLLHSKVILKILKLNTLYFLFV